VQAAHIRPIADSGPDSVRNGLAQSGTIHWMFDRGLLSLDDDLTILIAAGRVPDTVKRLINSKRKLLLPERPEIRPHRSFKSSTERALPKVRRELRHRTGRD
jgi:putative restriction endonuclease